MDSAASVRRLAVFALALFAVAQTADVGPFRKPDPERALAVLKRFDAAGSPLRQAREDWDGARKRIADDPAWQQWLDNRRRELDDWMSKRKDRVEWVAGWWHDFVSPKDGSFLTFTPDEPGEETLSSPSDPKVKLTPKLHGGWVFGFRSRHTSNVSEAAQMFRLTADRRYAEWAASQLDFYAGNWEKWPIQTVKSKSRLMHQSLDDANVLIRLVNAARLLDGFAPAERRERWIHKLFRPQALLLDETFQRIHNIACWQRSAMAVAALYAGDAELWKRAIDGPFGIRRQVEHGITSEYLWFEQSLLYNNYVVSALVPLFTSAALAGRAGELRQEMLIAQNMMLAPIMLRFPTGQLPNPADATGGIGRAPNLQVLASHYRLFPTALGLAEAGKRRSWETLLDPPKAVESAGSVPGATARDWTSSRMAVLREGDWQVYVHYGQLHASHAQAEALNFEAFHGSTDITHDAGTVGYGSPLHTGFYRTGWAHNVPMANGEGQARWQPGELVSFEPGRIVARQPLYRPGVSATRDLRIADGRLIDTVVIETTETEPQRLGLVVHLQGRIEAPADSSPATFVPPYWTEARSVSARDSFTIPVQFGEKRMAVTVATPGEFMVTLGRSPDVPPNTRTSIYVETRGARAAFTTTMAVQ